MPRPVAKKQPYRLEMHGDVRIDDYYWLRERDDPEVIAYLEAENAYVDEKLGHTNEFQAELFNEIKGRIKQTDVSVPFREGTHLYFWRYEEGKEYRVYYRQPQARTSEQAILDVNDVASAHEYCDVPTLEVSPDEAILAYATDTVGRRQYAIRFRDLVTGDMLPDRIPDVTSNLVWANDSRTVFYARQHPKTLRSFEVYRHRLGEDAAKDKRVYQEADETFSCSVGRSRSRRFILVASCHTLTTEYHVLDADHPNSMLSVFLPRKRGHEYHIDHYRDHFYVRSNANAKNFRLLKTQGAGSTPKQWIEVIPHRDDVLLETFEIFCDHLVLQERTDGLVRLRIRSWGTAGEHEIEFPEPAYDAYIDVHNRIPDTQMLRFGYSSLSTPNSTYDYDMVTRERRLLKREEVVGVFDTSHYRTERLYATGADGTRIPISLVARHESPLDQTSPLLLYGYGSYGISTDASFHSPRLSLLDRGFIFAIAHVRGGAELGRPWYEDGKLLRKRHTFTDFIACAEHLIDLQYTRPDRLFAIGGSAGGLLVGAVINMRPDVFAGGIAQVPFVDVVTTMLDETIPLTTGEYDEWGNPNDKLFYDYIKSYSPYDNVQAHGYPHLLVMTGLHDSQVQYWEPAKWVAKLRALKTDDHLLLLKTNMDAGHGGASGRYHQYREHALQYAFLIDLARSATEASASVETVR